MQYRRQEQLLIHELLYCILITVRVGSEICASRTTDMDAREYSDPVLERAPCLRYLRVPTDHLLLEP